MCGIFGIIPKKTLSPQRVRSLTNKLLVLSSSRGKDASGLAIARKDKLTVFKAPLPPQQFIKNSHYYSLFSENSVKGIIGHARMETNGSFAEDFNNQPVVKDGIVTIHNGIIVNHADLWKRNRDLSQKFTVDTEIINSLFRKYLNNHKSLISSCQQLFKTIQGSASIGMLFTDYDYLLLATNTGSLYFADGNDYVLFSSESTFLRHITNLSIKHISSGTGLLIDLNNLSLTSFNLKNSPKTISTPKRDHPRLYQMIPSPKLSSTLINRVHRHNDQCVQMVSKYISSHHQQNSQKINQLRRCTKCVLPETMPFIEFDDQGVCNYCRHYNPIKIKSRVSLNSILSQHRRKNGQPDCIVAFSGGRDSSYMLHLLKTKFHMHPLAFSYDWGMLTDLGRRNQARMTGQLGVEHLLVSADIQKKRDNIRKNVLAWLRRPQLGTIPLFMAGDKQYFYYANKVKRENNVDLVIMGENYYEKTMFKNGFAGIKQDSRGFMAYHVSGINKLKMMFYYAYNFITNPAYLNSSLTDSISAFLSYYFIPHNYLNFYDYVKWSESEVNRTLKEYDWELSPDTDTTWRIGDGTASFYNYIYYTVAGFSEVDTFISNQIRERDITRPQGLKLIKKYNFPRIESIKWYCDTIGIDFKSTIKIINSIKKLY